MRLDWQDAAIFVIFFTMASALEYGHRLVMLGAALILLGPLIVIERLAYPFLRRYPKLSVLAGILSVFAGGLLWLEAFRLP
jgi:hypothetical protein